MTITALKMQKTKIIQQMIAMRLSEGINLRMTYKSLTLLFQHLNGSKYERIRTDHRDTGLVAKVETTGVAATEKDLQDQVAPFQTSIWFCEPQTSI